MTNEIGNIHGIPIRVDPRLRDDEWYLVPAHQVKAFEDYLALREALFRGLDWDAVRVVMDCRQRRERGR